VNPIFKLAQALRHEIDSWRRRRAVRRLNDCAASFGFGPLTEQEWMAGMGRLSGVARKCGLSASGASANLTRAAQLLRRGAR